MIDLRGKVALVTGGATGIGKGIAGALSGCGATVAVAQPLPEQLSHLDPGVSGFLADIRDRVSVERMMEALVSKLGGVDIVVNNAAITGKPGVAPFLDCDPAKLDLIVDTNLKGTFHVSQLAARRMVVQGRGGSIVHIASVGAYAAQELASVYCATKAAVVSLAQGMALELAPHAIRVNAIAPGDIYTPANAAIVNDVKSAGGSGRFHRVTPLGRQGTPQDVGNAVAFLASDEAAFITGATLLVDGGFLAY